MKTLIHPPIVLGWLVAILLSQAGAAEPDPATPLPAQPARQVLMLENERTWIGEVSKDDEGNYQVRMLLGVTTVPANQVLTVCASLEEAYRFLRARANLKDPDERMRLANWCRDYDLPAQALEEAEAAAQLRPGDESIERLARYLRGRKDHPTPVAVRQAESPAPRVDLTDDALGMFATRIQPILMNTCASCHIGNRGGKFNLRRTYDTTLNNRATMQQNLTAVLAQINLREPASSPLLVKSVSIHGAGMTQAPVRNRALPAYRTLEGWVRLTLANNPHLLDRGEPLPPLGAAEGKTPPAASGPRWGDDQAVPGNSGRASEGAIPLPAPPVRSPGFTPTPSAPKPEQTPAASPDPVNPDDFNRQFHPERASPSKK
jgi:hypothetical protein